jgi:hypothetical protein
MTMRLLILIVVALLSAPLLLTQSAAGVQQRTRVAIIDESPLVVRGTGFKPAERVTVTVTHGKTIFRRVVLARTTGVVVARWTSSLPTTCASTFVLAVGSKGSRATYKIVVNDCAQPKAPDDPIMYPIDPQPPKPS